MYSLEVLPDEISDLHHVVHEHVDIETQLLDEVEHGIVDECPLNALYRTISYHTMRVKGVC